MLDSTQKAYLIKAIILIMIPSFLYSRAVTTVCIILLLLLSCTTSDRTGWKHFIHSHHFAFFILVFLGVFISGINSENTSAWWLHCNMKLPFIFMPLTFYLLPRFSKEWVWHIHVWFIIVMVLASLPVALTYFLDPASAIQAISVGQAIETPVEHVKYSMLNAYAVVSGLVYLRERNRGGRPVYLLLIVFTGWLFIYMHILAVRTGLVIAYVSIIILVVIWVKSRTGAFALVSAVLLMLYIGVRSVPTLNQKWGYMKYDWNMSQAGRGGNYSDADRIITFRAGLDLFKTNPFLGTGIGDLKTACIDLYNNRYDRPGLSKLPHNQFLYLAAGSGLLGLLFFLTGFYGPLLSGRIKRPLLLTMLYLNYTLSFAVENSLERSFSVAFFLLFALLWISLWDTEGNT